MPARRTGPHALRMRTLSVLAPAVLISCLLLLGCHEAKPESIEKNAVFAGKGRRIPLSVLEDKIRGGWAGKMIGVVCGAPLEFTSRGAIIEGDLPGVADFTPGRVREALAQDDLY